LSRVLASFEQLVNRLGRSALFSSLLAIVFGGFVFSGGSSADASCGDYLNHHGILTESHSNSQPGSQDQGPVPTQLPCRGPHCQQAPVETPIPVPVISFEGQDRWIWITTIQLRPTDLSCSLPQICEPVISHLCCDRLDRPPRI
jgi:hypothetical protein